MTKPTLPQSVTEKSPFGSPGWQVRHPTEKIMVAGIRKSRTKTCNRAYAEPSISIRHCSRAARLDEFEAAFVTLTRNGFFIVNNHRTKRNLGNTTKPDWRSFH
jgi:hypothetical protein